LSSEKYETGSGIAFAVDLRGLLLGASSGSSSEGVGKTLKGVFVELFRGVFAVAFAGVAATPAAVDRLFLGDALVSSSYTKE
jgi:hypothetical protein